jgi:MHS family proline/betaine transporter-like MFS transporter
MKKTLLAGAIGNVLEWYDFALYGYFAPVLASLLFPSDSRSLSLISAFGVFTVGFLARPLGAMLFGYWGDTLGRRHALAWSILLMAVPTCLVGLLPTYGTIGVLAPIALTLCRFLQGLSVGGEFTGSATFLVEHAAASQRGYVGSWAGFSAQIGALLGSGVGALIASSLTEEALHQWGWRIPFVRGGLIAVAGWYVRTSVPESLVACYMGPFFAAVADLFPTPQRYTGLSVGYNIGAALFGGTAPLIATLLIEWSGNVLAPAFYLSFCATVSFAVILTLRNK